jgi:hypothetical protein
MSKSIHLLYHPYLRFAVLGLSLVLFLHSFGCTSLRYAGAPPPSYNVDEDLKQLAEYFKPATAVSNYYSLVTPTPKDRDVVISARLVMINLEYLKWLLTVTADKQFLDTAADVLVLSLDLAATITGGKTGKTILSAVSAGVTGSKTSIDKHYYYEKTIPALIAAMNAQRKVVLERILIGMKGDLEDYSFEQALSDVYEYYQAGTFMGAVMAIQSDSGAKEKKADEKILMLTRPTPDEKEAVRILQPVWVKLYEDVKAGKLTQEQVNILRKALQNLKVDIPSADKEVLERLHRLEQQHEKSAVEILKALKDAGYPIPK